MAKPEWGVKRTCLACATRFYDMRKDPILCPSCGVKFDVETIFRPRRSRAAPDETPKPEAPAVKSDEDIEKELAALADDSAADDDDEDDDATIEDTSDLEDDNTDVPIVPKDINDES
ncbi:MAG: TIGR02300 family protein [Alphaproteobacteria bacterium]|nr:TIGR02300 family protein [Alphaproteobacteria bacterium]